MIKLIAIVDGCFGLSRRGEIPWSFREDMAFFRRQTEFSTVVMGRKTFDSISRNPLKNRVNCILSRSLKSVGDVEVFSSPSRLMDKYKCFWVMGGAEIFSYFLRNNLVNYALITKVHQSHDADRFMDESALSTFNCGTMKQNSWYTIYEYTKI
ncbi:MAG: dihydrofolate reductase [Holosporaceae bacterium]|nr:dihydrofolate reductase [Holosporaceae bacterium]